MTFTVNISLMFQPGVNQLIAHVKIGTIQLAIGKWIFVTASGGKL